MVLGKGVIQKQGVHAVGLNVLNQCCGFMHNSSVQNVQSDLECVGGYQGEIKSEERKKKYKKGCILILSKPERFLFLIFIVIQDRRIFADL